MKSRKRIIVTALCICITLGLGIVTISRHVWFDSNVTNRDYRIQDLDLVPQYLWGTWIVTEQLYGQYGWRECSGEVRGLTVEFRPRKFSFQNESREIPYYCCEIVAIEDVQGYFREATQFRQLGLEGQYYLKFYPEWDDLNDAIGWLWEYIVVSETEIVIPEARNGMYKMEKVKDYSVTEDEADSLKVIPHQSICYGVWEVTENLGNLYEPVPIGYKLGTFGEPCSFDYCRILGRNEEVADGIAELIGLDDGNDYLVYCKFSKDYVWDYMIIRDGMTAVLVKGDCIYQVRRISDPEKDSIYYELG